jgi:hypothetical protein
MAIDGDRALMPVVEPSLGPNAAPLRDALSQLQLAYAQLAGGGGEPGSGEGGQDGPTDPGAGGQGAGEAGGGPAQSSGRLWVPGQ